MNNPLAIRLNCSLINDVELLSDGKAGLLLKNLLRYVNNEQTDDSDIEVNISLEKIKSEIEDALIYSTRLQANNFLKNKNVRNYIFSRDEKCLKCGSKDNLTIDHIVPIAKGGLNRIENLQTLCRSCNCRKSAKTIDYRK